MPANAFHSGNRAISRVHVQPCGRPRPSRRARTKGEEGGPHGGTDARVYPRLVPKPGRRREDGEHPVCIPPDEGTPP